MSLHTKDLEICNGDLAELSSESWEAAVVGLSAVTVLTEVVTRPEVDPSQVTTASSVNGDVLSAERISKSDR